MKLGVQTKIFGSETFLNIKESMKRHKFELKHDVSFEKIFRIKKRPELKNDPDSRFLFREILDEVHQTHVFNTSYLVSLPL